MVAIGPAVRLGIKVAPIVIEVTRQLDRQLRPHVLAYRRAREVDGFVGSWTDERATHWLVFPERYAPPVVAFPPLEPAELAIAARAIDRMGLRYHDDLPEARLVAGARAAVTAPGRLRLRRDRDDLG